MKKKISAEKQMSYGVDVTQTFVEEDDPSMPWPYIIQILQAL